MNPTYELYRRILWALVACVATFSFALAPAANAQDCQVTFALQDDLSLGALDMTVSHASAPGAFTGAGTAADCTAHVDTTLEFFTLDPIGQTLRLQLLSIGGFGTSPGPTTLATCRYLGGSPAPDTLPITVTSSARPDLSAVVPPPTVTISSVVCGNCGNGIIDEGEQCDDSNGLDGDCCSSACQFELPGSSCSDGSGCTHSDSCTSNGLCLGQALDCSHLADGCNLGICQGGVCSAAPFNEGAGCDDGDACTVADACTGGTCAGTAKDCSSHDSACTIGACLPDGNCAAEVANDGASCDDGDLCSTDDVCSFGICEGTLVDCSAFDSQCSVGACSPTQGCVAEPLGNGATCDDGDNCTQSDTCTNGTCAGTATDCSHLDAGCSVGSCQPDGSCAAAPVADGESCNDRDPCTDNDVCADSTCRGQAKDCSDFDSACTVGACQADGSCAALIANNGASCVDGDACTTGDRCDNGICSGTATDCSELDGDCIVGTCQPDGSCAAVVAALGSPCDDGNACTNDDRCTESGCVGTPIDCSDEVGQCRTSSCDPVVGCVEEAILDGTVCNDGNVCTLGDRCNNGICTSGPTASCDDGDSCTIDSCDPVSGCSFFLDESSCAARSPCPSADLCSDDTCSIDTALGFARVIVVVTETGPPTLQLDARIPFQMYVPRPTETGMQVRVTAADGSEIFHGRIPGAGFTTKTGKRTRYLYNIATSQFVDLSGLISLEVRHDDAKRAAIITGNAQLKNADAAVAAQDMTVEIGFSELEPSTCVSWEQRHCETKIAGTVVDDNADGRPRERNRAQRRARLGRRVTCI